MACDRIVHVRAVLKSCLSDETCNRLLRGLRGEEMYIAVNSAPDFTFWRLRLSLPPGHYYGSIMSGEGWYESTLERYIQPLDLRNAELVDMLGRDTTAGELREALESLFVGTHTKSAARRRQ